MSLTSTISQMPIEGWMVLLLDLLIFVGWLVSMVRNAPQRWLVAMMAATGGVWFLGLGLALVHLNRACLIMESSGMGDPSSVARHLGEALLTSAMATQGAMLLTTLAVVALSIWKRPPVTEVTS